MKWLQIVALQKISRRKCDCFLRLLSWQTIYFLEFLINLTPIIMEEGTKNNLACQSHQALIENFAAGIDFIPSAHF